MLPDGRRLGAHLPLGFGLVKAVERAHAVGAEALQVFADNPTAWRRRAAPPSEQARFREKLIEYDIGPTAITPRTDQPGRPRRDDVRPVRGPAGQRAANRARLPRAIL
jgi:hypothetical protein